MGSIQEESSMSLIGWCFFPNSGSQAQMKRLLSDFLGLERSVIKRNKTLKSRWCCIHKNYPMFVMSQRDIYQEESSMSLIGWCIFQIQAQKLK
jgi:hypothetical protein